MELQQLPESRALLRRKIEIENETIEMTGQAVRELEANSQKIGGDIEALESLHRHADLVNATLAIAGHRRPTIDPAQVEAHLEAIAHLFGLIVIEIAPRWC